MLYLSLSVSLAEVCRMSLPIVRFLDVDVSTGTHFGPWQQNCREQWKAEICCLAIEGE